MRRQEIEAWVEREIIRATAPIPRPPQEDARVELKREWPKDANTAARQIAGHANAARTDRILWIIGIDEKSGVVNGVAPQDFTDWWKAVSAEFDDVVPNPTELVLPRDGMHVVAILFRTDGAPYAVKNAVHGKSGGGAVTWEIPWREGASVRSARRRELLTILVNKVRLPDIEIMSARVTTMAERGNDGTQSLAWEVNGQMFFNPKGNDAVVMPYHRLRVSFAGGGLQEPLELKLSQRSFYVAHIDSRRLGAAPLERTLEPSPSEMVIKKAGVARFGLGGRTAVMSLDRSDIVLTVRVHIAEADAASPATITLPAATPPQGRSNGWEVPEN